MRTQKDLLAERSLVTVRGELIFILSKFMGLSDKYKEKKEHLEKQTLAFCLNMYLDRFYSGKEFGHFQ